VKFQTDKKLAIDGEKMERDWIFSRLLKGKKSILSPAKVRIINNTERGVRSLKKEGERTR
jgi:hypothetical protein